MRLGLIGWSLIFFSHTTFFTLLHLRPPVLARRRVARRAEEWCRECEAGWWAAGDDTSAPASSSATRPSERVEECFLEDLVDPPLPPAPPPSADLACARASSTVEATRRTERPGWSFLDDRWCQRTTWPLSAGSMVTSGGRGSSEESITAAAPFRSLTLGRGDTVRGRYGRAASGSTTPGMSASARSATSRPVASGDVS